MTLVQSENLVHAQARHLLHSVHFALPDSSPKDLRENAGCFYSSITFSAALHDLVLGVSVLQVLGIEVVVLITDVLRP